MIDAMLIPLISLGGLADNDGDGRPDDCDSDCLANGMAADRMMIMTVLPILTMRTR